MVCKIIGVLSEGEKIDSSDYTGGFTWGTGSTPPKRRRILHPTPNQTREILNTRTSYTESQFYLTWRSSTTSRRTLLCFVSSTGEVWTAFSSATVRSSVRQTYCPDEGHYLARRLVYDFCDSSESTRTTSLGARVVGASPTTFSRSKILLGL